MVAFALAIYAAYLHLQIWDTRGVNGFLTAYTGLLRDAAEISCVQKNSIIEIAKRNKFRIDNNIHEWRLDFGQSKEDIDGLENNYHSVRIYIKPEMPFSKEPGVVFRFSSRGCLQSRR
jgi:hypothetical protein